ncbi:MAG: hypothetical protein WCB05_16655 [Candidatus Sulfotelmatobacter sp.]
MTTAHHQGYADSQSIAESAAKHTEYEDVPQLAHLKNVLLSGIPFFWRAHQEWNPEGTQSECPYGHPSESNRDTNDNWND